jgi:hypothetical protein
VVEEFGSRQPDLSDEWYNKMPRLYRDVHINHLTKQAKYYTVSFRDIHINMFGVEKPIGITHTERPFAALVIQHTMRMRHYFF